MFARVAYVLSALLVGASALAGVQFSSAEWTEQSRTGVSIGAAPDWTPPMVSVDDPGFALSGTVTVTARAADTTSAVESVTIEYRPDSGAWSALCKDTSSPYSCDWNTKSLVDGPYELRASAVDAAGNSALSAVVLTEVRNAAGIVLAPVSSPARGTLPLSAEIVKAGPGDSSIAFQYATSNQSAGPWTDIPGCTGAGPTFACSFDTASITGTVAVRAVGTVKRQSYQAVQTDVILDNTAPTVTIDQAAGQADPTSASPVRFTVLFSEPVTGFTADGVLLGGTAGGTKLATVTGSGATYTVAVTGMSGDGTVTASVRAGAVRDQAGNTNPASTSTDNSVQFVGTPLSVTVNQAAAQADPTNGSTITFTVVFNRSVSDFATGAVTVGGTAPGSKTATVTGSGTTYTVAVTGMTGSGTVTASIAAGRATDSFGNVNQASTSTDNTVTRDVTPPSVTINQAASQADPTNSPSIDFTVVFSEPVTGFGPAGVSITGTAPGTKSVAVSGSGTTYTVRVTGMTGGGTVVANLNASAATDLAGNASLASTSTDNTVTRDVTAPTVTINQAVGQADPTNGSTVDFTVVFSKPVTGFGPAGVNVAGTAPGTKAVTVTGSGTTYSVRVSGMTGSGTVIATLTAGAADDAAGNASLASTSTDNTVTRDVTAPTVTIDQAAGQADPTNGSTVDFTVVFSEPVTGFGSGGVTVSGTATGTKTVTVTGSGTTYNVRVSGMTSGGTVVATVNAAAAADTAGNASLASTSTDNTVTRDVTPPSVTINQAASQADPTNSPSIDFTVVFSEPVTGFGPSGVAVSGTAAGARTVSVTGSGSTYTVTVSGMTGAGTVIATLNASAAADLAGNASLASTSTDNTVTRDLTAPGVSVARVGTATQTGATVNFTVTFTEPVTGFTTGDLTLTGTAPGPLTGTVTGSGTTYNVAVTGMTTDGTIIASVAAGVAQDLAGNDNTASGGAAAGRTVTWNNGRAPTVTVNQASGQADPTNGTTMSFAVEFSEPVTGLTANGFTINTVLGGTRTLTGSGASYVLTITGMTQQGTVTVTLPASRANDLSGAANTASTSTDNSVTRDTTAPTVTINKATGQADPATGTQINFTVVFSETVVGFDSAGVNVTGTAGGAKTVTVTGSGTTYNVRVTGMTTAGTVIASIPAGRATDLAGNANTASTSSDNNVAWSP